MWYTVPWAGTGPELGVSSHLGINVWVDKIAGELIIESTTPGSAITPRPPIGATGGPISWDQSY